MPSDSTPSSRRSPTTTARRGRAGEPDKAVEFAVRAGEQASYQLAYAEAVDFYTRALAVLSDDDGRRRKIMLRRAVAYQALTHALLDARVR